MSKKQKEGAEPSRLKGLSKKKTKRLLRIISVVGAIMFVARIVRGKTHN